MALEDIVSVNITTTTVRVSRAGFGTPLIAAYHTNDPGRVLTYSASTALTSMVTDGFATSDPAYLAASKILSQNPRPSRIKIGRRDNTWTQVTRVTPDAPSAGEVFAVKINDTDISVTASGTPNVAEITDALTTAINGSAEASAVTASDAGTHVTITADAAASLFGTQYVVGYAKNFTILDQTVDGNIEDDLALIRAADPDFYGVVVDSPGTIDIANAAAWAETQSVLFIAESADTDILTSSTTDVASDLQDLAYDRTALLYHPDARSFANAAWMGVLLPTDPGSATWAYKTLRGAAVYSLTATEEGFVDAKAANHYQEVGGVNITRKGTSASGFFLDLTRGIDWLTARIQESVFGLIAARPKLPYTDESVNLILAQVQARLDDAVSVGLLRSLDDDGFPPTATAPKVADVDPLDRADRLLPDVQFSGVLAGAIHSVQIQGSLSI